MNKLWLVCPLHYGMWYDDDIIESAFNPTVAHQYGLIITDSFPMMRGPEKWQYYAMKFLKAVYDQTGTWVVMMVLPGGSFHEKAWFQVLKTIINIAPCPPQWMVWLLTGNDLCPPGRTVEFPYTRSLDSYLREHATKLLLRAKHVCPEQRLIYGGCTRNWEYDGKWSPGQCAQYNRAAHQLVKYVKINADVSAMTGLTLFEGLKIVDRIGHVSHESMDLMVEIFVKTTRWGMVRTVSSVPWYRSLL